MGRRVSSGVVGGTGLGSLSVVSSTISSTTTDGDITLDPNGAGTVLVDSDLFLHDQADLQFGDADSSNYVAIQAPTTLAANYTLTLPTAVAVVSGYALTSDTSGNLSWSAAGAALTDNTSDSGTNYVAFTTQSSGFLTTSRVSTTGLTFQPSTSTLAVGGPVKSIRSENIQTGNYTLALTDRDIIVTMNNTTGSTVTVPPNSSVAFPVGSVVRIARVNSGSVALAAGSGVTLSKTGNFGENEEIAIRKRATDSWIVIDSEQNLTGSGGTTTTPTGFSLHQFTSTGSDTFTVA